MLNSLSMLPIPQMDLKIAHRRLRSRSIQFARAVMASYAREKHPFHTVGGLAGRGCGTGYFGLGVYGGVAHCAFEVVIWVALLEFRETFCQPFWRVGLEGG